MPCGRMTADQTSGGHDRLSCGCGRAVVRQPHMGQYRWDEARREFRVKHMGDHWVCPECGDDDYLCEHVCLECRRPCPCGTCGNGYCERCCDLHCGEECLDERDAG